MLVPFPRICFAFILALVPVGYANITYWPTNRRFHRIFFQQSLMPLLVSPVVDVVTLLYLLYLFLQRPRFVCDANRDVRA